MALETTPSHNGDVQTDKRLAGATRQPTRAGSRGVPRPYFGRHHDRPRDRHHRRRSSISSQHRVATRRKRRTGHRETPAIRRRQPVRQDLARNRERPTFDVFQGQVGHQHPTRVPYSTNATQWPDRSRRPAPHATMECGTRRCRRFRQHRPGRQRPGTDQVPQRGLRIDHPLETTPQQLHRSR